jgi:hypothetical protein
MFHTTRLPLGQKIPVQLRRRCFHTSQEKPANARLDIARLARWGIPPG